jgi:hypothetical protein
MPLTSAPSVIRRIVATLAVSGLVLTGTVATSAVAVVAALTNLSHLNLPRCRRRWRRQRMSSTTVLC